MAGRYTRARRDGQRDALGDLCPWAHLPELAADEVSAEADSDFAPMGAIAGSRPQRLDQHALVITRDRLARRSTG
jgi:hypothetical protein